MEYLMTYGWAILVVMVVGIVMWQLGIFNIGGVTSTTATGFPRIKPQLALIEVRENPVVPGTFIVKGTFTNGAGGPTRIVDVVGTCDHTAVGAYPTQVITAGDNFEVEGATCAISGGSGDPYEIYMNITYNVSLAGSTVQHTDYGRLRGPIE